MRNKPKLYNVWANMIQRTTNSNRSDYKYYGGRGIFVCEEWRSFEKFNEDMLPTFSDGLTLDRIDVNLGYFKDNCRWVSMSDQNRNKRTYENSPTGKSGVSAHKGRWRARAYDHGKSISLGVYLTVEEAHRAVDEYWKRKHSRCSRRKGSTNEKSFLNQTVR